MYKPGLCFKASSPGIFLLSLVLGGCSYAGLKSGMASRPGAATQGSNRIVCWGDSMTAGNEGITDTGTYPALLQAAIGPTIVNEGIGGQTSTQVGVRQGGVPSYVTVEGGLIPSQGGVTVKFATGYEPVSLPTHTLQGSIQGVAGVVSLTGFLPAGTFTFTPASGSKLPVRINGTPRFIPQNPYQSYVPIFWEGRDNLFPTTAGPYGPAQIESDIAGQVATVPRGSNFLVLSVLNENYAGERKGGAKYPTLIGLNDALSATYGTHYLDVRTPLVQAYDPASPVDVTDHHYDMIPTSLGAILGQGTLAGSIGSSDTTFTLKMTTGSLLAYRNLVIGNELIRVLAVSGSTVTSCTRGYGGVLASHTAGTAVTERDPTHLSKQGYAIVAGAVQARLARTY